MSRLPYATPEEGELPARDGYDIIEGSRFDDPDVKPAPPPHPYWCRCQPCLDAERVERNTFHLSVPGIPYAQTSACGLVHGNEQGASFTAPRFTSIRSEVTCPKCLAVKLTLVKP